MAEKNLFKVQARDVKGKKVKVLRNDGLIPANIINPVGDSTMIAMGHSDFNRLYAKVGDTGVIYLQVEGDAAEKPVLIEEVSLHPVTGHTDHVIFRQVNLKVKIEAEVPVEIVGEVNVPNSVLLTVASEITVEALPTDLPEKFVVDVSTLTEIGQSITYAQLEYDKNKVELQVEDLESPVVLLQEVKEEVVEVAPEAAEAEAAPAAEGGEAAPEKTAETEAKAE